MIKLILLICMVVIIMAVAQGLCKQYRERYSIYTSLNDFFMQMRLNLGFQKQKIKQILNQSIIKKTSKDTYTAYLNYLENGQALDLSFMRVLDDIEQEHITNMLLSLGKNDTSGELKQLDAYEIYLQDKIISTKADKDKYCPLITKLSLLFGIGLAILFV